MFLYAVLLVEFFEQFFFVRIENNFDYKSRAIDTTTCYAPNIIKSEGGEEMFYDENKHMEKRRKS